LTISALRTLIGPPWCWPMAEPDDVLDYSIDITAALADVADALDTVTLAVSPWGAGELVASQLIVAGGVITGWLGPGLAGRNYIVRIEGLTVAGRTFEWFVDLLIDPDRVAFPLPLPPNLDFGGTLTWHRPRVPVPAEIYTVAANSSVFYFMGGLNGPFTALPVPVRVPAEIYTVAGNSSVFYFGGGLIGAFTPSPPSARVPSLNFSDRRNAGLRRFPGQPRGTFYLPSTTPAFSPAQNYADARNASVFYLDGELTGAFTPFS
jgi:hypothetical protein